MNLDSRFIISYLNIKKLFFLNLITIFLFIIDRLAKKIFFATGGEYFIFGDWLKLKLALNPGIAFGIEINFFILLVGYILIFLCLAWFLVDVCQKRRYFMIFCFGLIIAGAFSNLLDRFYIGQVIDYIDVKYFSVFNLADAMIVGGVVGILSKGINNKK